MQSSLYHLMHASCTPYTTWSLVLLPYLSSGICNSFWVFIRGQLAPGRPAPAACLDAAPTNRDSIRVFGLATEAISLPTSWSPTEAYSCPRNRRGERVLSSMPPSLGAPLRSIKRMQGSRRREGQDEEGDATHDLLLKHPVITLATYV
jgi:hypothetical protein